MNTFEKRVIITGIIFLILGTSLGAIGAHALENIEGIEPENIESWKTGVLYQLLQGLGIFAIYLLGKQLNLENLKTVFLTIIIGTLCFSGSIYLLVLNNNLNIDILKYIMIPLTPLGGLLMIIGWIMFSLKISKLQPNQ